MAFKNVWSFVVQRGASEHCSRKRIYLLSVRMNKAFHHLAAVLERAPNETPPSLAPRSPVRGGSRSFTLVQNVGGEKKSSKCSSGLFFPFFLIYVFFSLLKRFSKSFSQSAGDLVRRSLAAQQRKPALTFERCDSPWDEMNESGTFQRNCECCKMLFIAETLCRRGLAGVS